MHHLMHIIRRLGPLLPMAGFFFSSILFLSLARLALALFNWERVVDFHTLVHVLLVGIRMDTALLCMVTVVPVLVTLLLPAFITGSKHYRLFISVFLCIWATLFVLMELATPHLYSIAFFDTRPGRIFFEYLNHPREVGLLLLGGFVIQSIFVFIGTVLGAVAAYAGVRRLQAQQTTYPYSRQLLILPFVLALLVLGARSTLGHRPINASSVAFSNDQLLNELGLSSTYTVLYALYGLKNEGDPSQLYPAMSDKEVIRRVRRNSLVDERRFFNPAPIRQKNPVIGMTPYS